MTSRSKINGILKRCGQLLDQHYHYTGYTPPDEEMSPYRVARKQLYCILELQEVVDLEYRLEKLHQTLRETGANKSKLAMIDRLVHHGHLILFEGQSYRMTHALMRQKT